MRRHRSWPVVALVLAATIALAWSDVAVAQQSERPTQLWEQYPLDPERSVQQPESGAPQAPDRGSAGRPAGADDSGGSAASGERFPLLPIVVTLAVLLLFLFHGVGISARGRHLPELALPGPLRGRLNRWPVALDGFRSLPAAARSRSVRLRERVSAVRGPSLPEWPRLGPASGGLRLAFLERGSEPRYPLAMPATREKERERRPGNAPGVPDPAEAGDKPAKPPKPKVRAPAQKQRSAKKPRAAKPPQPAKPPKPVRPTKPVRTAEHEAPPVSKKPVSAPPPKPRRPARKKFVGEKAPGRAQPQLVDAKTLTERKLTCSIVWLRDGPVSDFYALATGLQGHDFVVGRSPEFEWLGGDVPAEAREAHGILVDALVGDGWRPVGSEGAWYRQRFERPVGGGGPESSEP